MLALSVAVTIFSRYAASDHLRVKDQIEADEVAWAMRHSPSFVLYGIGIAVSLVLPTAGIAHYLVSTISRGARSPTQVGTSHFFPDKLHRRALYPSTREPAARIERQFSRSANECIHD